jgi:hypothetical protein
MATQKETDMKNTIAAIAIATITATSAQAEQSIQEFCTTIGNEAYESYRSLSEEGRTRQIEDFRNRWELECFLQAQERGDF